MRPRFTISRKIGSGFAVLLFTTLVVFFLTYDTLKEGREINDKITNVYNPSVSALEKLKSAILRSRTSINHWAYVQSREDTKEKMSLLALVNEEIPELKSQVDSLSINWTDRERRKKEKVYSELSELLKMYDVVRVTLSDMRSYDDPFAKFNMAEYAEEGGLIFLKSGEVITALNELIAEHRQNTTSDSITMIRSFDRLEGYLRNMSFALFIFGLVIAYFTVQSIVKPVSRLKEILIQLGKGIFPERAVVSTNDEIGEMSTALEQLVKGLKRTTEFSREVGKGNFDIEYEPLSNEDELGRALLYMRDELKEAEKVKIETERILEQKVEERTREVVKQKNKIEKQNSQRKELLENITASIRYAKRLQESILPSREAIKELLPESFIFFKPKDIVSGDFYFLKKQSNKVIFASVDCTGHGVPGAFMSLVGHNALSRALAESKDLDPAKIIDKLSKYAADALNRTADYNNGRDGMDMALCVYDKEQSTLEYAGAFSPLYICRNGELLVFKPDKIVIGSADHANYHFSKQHIKLLDGDMIYIFSDGYVDQFGGEKGRKFMYEPFRKVLLEIAPVSVDKQLKAIENNMELWRGSGGKTQMHDQVDDMLIIGVRHVV
jgi:serine phosphatase RsbU (regulator of sigma subunit)